MANCLWDPKKKADWHRVATPKTKTEPAACEAYFCDDCVARWNVLTYEPLTPVAKKRRKAAVAAQPKEA